MVASNFLKVCRLVEKFKFKHQHKYRSYGDFGSLFSSLYSTEWAKNPGRILAMSQKESEGYHRPRIFCLPCD
jgi:hypothetical protein